MIIVLPASEFEPGKSGYRLAMRDENGSEYVPGWFEDAYPEMASIFPTAAAARTCAEGLGFVVSNLRRYIDHHGRFIDSNGRLCIFGDLSFDERRDALCKSRARLFAINAAA